MQVTICNTLALCCVLLFAPALLLSSHVLLPPNAITDDAGVLLCSLLCVGAARMVKLEVYAMNQNTTTIDGVHFKAFQQALVQDADQQRHKGTRVRTPSNRRPCGFCLGRASGSRKGSKQSAKIH